MKGFNAKDVVHVSIAQSNVVAAVVLRLDLCVQLGDFHAMAPFGLLYSCNSPGFPLMLIFKIGGYHDGTPGLI